MPPPASTCSVVPTASSRSASRGRAHRPVDHLGNERLAERDGRRSSGCRRSRGNADRPRRRARARAPPPSARAGRSASTSTRRMLPCTSITLLGRGAGALVQLVDVLRDERMQLAAPLERDERAVAGVRLGRPRRRIEPRCARRPSAPRGRRGSAGSSTASRRPGSSSTRPAGRGSRGCRIRSRCRRR